MENLLKYIYGLAAFSDHGWELLKPALSTKVFRKNQFLLEEEEVCRSLFYIDKGFCRSYYEIDGQVKNTGFYFENNIAVNLSSFGSGQKSAFNIIACEPVTAILFDKDKLTEAAKQSHEIESLGRNCIRLFASRQEEFSNLLILHSAKDRLAYLEINYPEMLQRVPLTQLASFIGVARETLSRIRSRRVVT